MVFSKSNSKNPQGLVRGNFHEFLPVYFWSPDWFLVRHRGEHEHLNCISLSLGVSAEATWRFTSHRLHLPAPGIVQRSNVASG